MKTIEIKVEDVAVKGLETEGLPEKMIPRNGCLRYIRDNNIEKGLLLSKADFDSLCKKSAFRDGPKIDCFGDGYGEPYNPWRQAFGILSNDIFVYCETNEMENKKVENFMLEIQNQSQGRKC